MNKNKQRMGKETKKMNRSERRKGDDGTAQKETTGKARRGKKVGTVPRTGASVEGSTRSRGRGPRDNERRRRATAEAGTGLRPREGMEDGRSGKRGRAKTQRGRHGGQKKAGAKRNKAKAWGKESAEEYLSG